MTRLEIRRRALYSAATVTLMMGFLGCAASVEVDQAADEALDPADPVHSADSPAASAAPTATAVTGSVGPVMGAPGALPSIKTCVLKPGDAGWTDYQKCCEQVQWDPKAGCEAWGPPMPPAMEVA